MSAIHFDTMVPRPHRGNPSAWRQWLPLLALASAVTAGCSNGPNGATGGQPSAEQTSNHGRELAAPSIQRGFSSGEPTVSNAAATPLVVHEWGTFTSVSGSDGVILAGLQHEEEALPGFVVGRRFTCPPQVTKCAEERVRKDVTQKLETPVIYFYGDPGTSVAVDVRFPAGLISQWYPHCESFEPPVELSCPDDTCGAVAPAGGRMSWRVELLGDDVSPKLQPVTLDSVWAPSRNVASRAVRVHRDLAPGATEYDSEANAWVPADPDSDERFIFYRGLGSFTLPIRIEDSGGGVLRASNGSQQHIPALFVLRTNGEEGAFAGPFSLPAGGLLELTDPAIPAPSESGTQTGYAEALGGALVAELVKQGLFEDEAWALVHTWARSYFLTPGLRVLYVLPRAWTDALLPITLTPAPDQLERVLVGRVEVMTRADERHVMRKVSKWVAQGVSPSPLPNEVGKFLKGRFAEAHLRRALELFGKSAESEWLTALLSQPDLM